MIVPCKPLTKDHLPLKTAFSGPKGWWSLVTGFTVKSKKLKIKQARAVFTSVLTYGAKHAGLELLIHVSHHDARLAHAAVPYHQNLVQHLKAVISHDDRREGGGGAARYDVDIFNRPANSTFAYTSVRTRSPALDLLRRFHDRLSRFERTTKYEARITAAHATIWSILDQCNWYRTGIFFAFRQFRLHLC